MPMLDETLHWTRRAWLNCLGKCSSTLRRSMGVCHASSSRSHDFAEDALVVDGASDLVLNSLTSPGTIAASISAMRSGGR